VQLTEKGAVCRFKSEKKCIFIPAKGIKNFSTAVAGSRIACNAAKCKHSNLVYQPANKKMFGRAYLCNGYVCTRCKRHFMSKAEAQKGIIHGWKLYRRGRVNINNSLMPVFSLIKPSKK
jgi:hypothetical protein